MSSRASTTLWSRLTSPTKTWVPLFPLVCDSSGLQHAFTLWPLDRDVQRMLEKQGLKSQKGRFRWNYWKHDPQAQKASLGVWYTPYVVLTIGSWVTYLGLRPNLKRPSKSGVFWKKLCSKLTWQKEPKNAIKLQYRKRNKNKSMCNDEYSGRSLIKKWYSIIGASKRSSILK